MNLEFNFLFSIKFNIDSFLSIYKEKIISSKPKYGISFWIRFILFMIIAYLSFLSKYSFFIGIFIVIFYIYIFIEPQLLLLNRKRYFYKRNYFSDVINYSLNEKEIRISGKDINIKTTWPSLYNWHFRENWLILTFHDAPSVYLPIQRLKEEGVFYKIKAIAMNNGPEYR